jgi:hypothetical protein
MGNLLDEPDVGYAPWRALSIEAAYRRGPGKKIGAFSLLVEFETARGY